MKDSETRRRLKYKNDLSLGKKETGKLTRIMTMVEIMSILVIVTTFIMFKEKTPVNLGICIGMILITITIAIALEFILNNTVFDKLRHDMNYAENYLKMAKDREKIENARRKD